MWYLSKGNGDLEPFHPAVDVNEKRLLVANINTVAGSEEAVQRVWIPKPQGKTLADCCSSRTKELFNLLDVPSDFVEEENSAKWEDMESFTDTRERVILLNVVKGVTEPGVVIAHEFMKMD